MIMNPYVPFQLNEISVLKSLKTWNNSRVRIFGKVGQSIQNFLENDLELRYIHSVGEEIQSTIIVNFSLISDIFNSKFNEGNVVQILGDLHSFEKKVDGIIRPLIVSAHIIRDFSLVDPDLYHRASTIQSIACPKEFFMKASNANASQEDTSFEGNSSSPSFKYIRTSSQSADDSDAKGEPCKNPTIDKVESNDSSVDMFEDSE